MPIDKVIEQWKRNTQYYGTSIYDPAISPMAVWFCSRSHTHCDSSRFCRAVAQWPACAPWKREVAGSNPACPTEPRESSLAT
jgi:hypothetical protein